MNYAALAYFSPLSFLLVLAEDAERVAAWRRSERKYDRLAARAAGTSLFSGFYNPHRLLKKLGRHISWGPEWTYIEQAASALLKVAMDSADPKVRQQALKIMEDSAVREWPERSASREAALILKRYDAAGNYDPAAVFGYKNLFTVAMREVAHRRSGHLVEIMEALDRMHPRMGHLGTIYDQGPVLLLIQNPKAAIPVAEKTKATDLFLKNMEGEMSGVLVDDFMFKIVTRSADPVIARRLIDFLADKIEAYTSVAVQDTLAMHAVYDRHKDAWDAAHTAAQEKFRREEPGWKGVIVGLSEDEKAKIPGHDEWSRRLNELFGKQQKAWNAERALTKLMGSEKFPEVARYAREVLESRNIASSQDMAWIVAGGGCDPKHQPRRVVDVSKRPHPGFRAQAA